MAEALNARKKPLNGSKILLIGLAYKANVDDDRESPTYILMDMLTEAGADVAYYDPYVPVIRSSREHSHWAGQKSITWDRSEVSQFDAALISTAHANVNYEQLIEWAQLVVDTRNATRNFLPNQKSYWPNNCHLTELATYKCNEPFLRAVLDS